MAHTATHLSTPRLPARSVPPYHTGKVSIGIAHVPRQRPHHDRDAMRLQDALLIDLEREQTLRRELDAEVRIGVLCAVVLAVVVGLLCAGVL